MARSEYKLGSTLDLEESISSRSQPNQVTNYIQQQMLGDPWAYQGNHSGGHTPNGSSSTTLTMGSRNVSPFLTTNTQQQRKQTQTKIMTIPTIQKPSKKSSELMHQRLSLNGTTTAILKHLDPSPRPLLRDLSSRSIQPLTSAEAQMSIDIDGGSPSVIPCTDPNGYYTTELSITPSLNGDDQFIVDLGSLRRFSIDRQSFMGKLVACACVN